MRDVIDRWISHVAAQFALSESNAGAVIDRSYTEMFSA